MIFVASDHHGVELKAKINEWLKGRNYEFEDLGAFEYNPWDDFVDFAIDAAQRVAVSPEKNRGILICGSGVGVGIAANKVGKIRAGLGFAPDQVYEARKKDGINVLALAADYLDETMAVELVDKFLNTEFVESDAYLRREEKIIRYEEQSTQNKRS